MKTNKIKILCYLDIDKGRDIEILMPVIFYAEKYLNAKVDYSFIWEVHDIYRKKPDVVLIANTIGSKLHFEISKYAYKNGIKVFALISEGNFRTNGTFNYYGYNTDKQFYQDYICHWSKRTYDYLVNELPQFKDQMVVTGATGFDRYKIYDFLSRKEFLEKWKLLDFKKVIGYAGWAFGKLFNAPGRKELRYLQKDNPNKLKWMEDQMYLVEDILRQTVENNPDTLFILKRHPSEKHPHITQPDKNEMVALADYPNVMYFTNEEDVHDLINISDLWMGFETTTALETWVMGNKPTILINPDPDFKRDKLYQGSCIAKNYNELQSFIDEFYKTGKIKAFESEEKQNSRNKLIKDTIGFSDGMNHVRTGYYLSKTMNQIGLRKKKRMNLNMKYYVMYALLHIGKHFYNRNMFQSLPKFKKTIWLFERFKLNNASFLKAKYYPMLERFHEKHQIPQKIHSDVFWNDLLNLN
jgi:surface carbohydrate biosynthesis protein